MERKYHFLRVCFLAFSFPLPIAFAYPFALKTLLFLVLSISLVLCPHHHLKAFSSLLSVSF
jgi:hypothetical protein